MPITRYAAEYLGSIRPALVEQSEQNRALNGNGAQAHAAAMGLPPVEGETGHYRITGHGSDFNNRTAPGYFAAAALHMALAAATNVWHVRPDGSRRLLITR